MKNEIDPFPDWLKRQAIDATDKKKILNLFNFNVSRKNRKLSKNKKDEKNKGKKVE